MNTNSTFEKVSIRENIDDWTECVVVPDKKTTAIRSIAVEAQLRDP